MKKIILLLVLDLLQSGKTAMQAAPPCTTAGVATTVNVPRARPAASSLAPITIFSTL